MLGRIGFAFVQWKSRRGLPTLPRPFSTNKSRRRCGWACAARRMPIGICGGRATSSSRGITCPRAKGEFDLVGYDGATLAFVEVRTRVAVKGKTALPELSISQEKHEVLVRTAHAFLRERHVKECPVRFDVVAIDNTPGKPPVVRLHKAALSPGGPSPFRLVAPCW